MECWSFSDRPVVCAKGWLRFAAARRANQLADSGYTVAPRAINRATTSDP
jgi:hypothetical protein